jgi:hypothetical protein
MGDRRGAAPALLVLAEGAGSDALLAALALGREYCRESGARLEVFGAGVEQVPGAVVDTWHALEATDAGARLWLALGQSLAAGQSPMLLRAGRSATVVDLRRLREMARENDGAFLFDAKGRCAALALSRAMPELFTQLDWNGPVMVELRRRARKRGWRLGELLLESEISKVARS